MARPEHNRRVKFANNDVYSVGKITTSLSTRKSDFSAKLLSIKAGLLRQYCPGKRVLDIGCADGRHLRELKDEIKSGIGLDYSVTFVQAAKEQNRNCQNLEFVLADARFLPLSNESVDLVYSFASIYTIDDVDELYREISRVLAPGGIAILEIGNSRSLATLVSRQYSQFAQHSYRRLDEHFKKFEKYDLRVNQIRSFQILPMWGDKPTWLRPLRHRLLESAVQKKINGKMLDEWISSLPGLRKLAFRHLVVCQKI